MYFSFKFGIVVKGGVEICMCVVKIYVRGSRSRNVCVQIFVSTLSCIAVKILVLPSMPKEEIVGLMVIVMNEFICYHWWNTYTHIWSYYLLVLLQSYLDYIATNILEVLIREYQTSTWRQLVYICIYKNESTSTWRSSGDVQRSIEGQSVYMLWLIQKICFKDPKPFT